MSNCQRLPGPPHRCVKQQRWANPAPGAHSAEEAPPAAGVTLLCPRGTRLPSAGLEQLRCLLPLVPE